MATNSVKNVIINVKANTQGIKNLQTEVDKLTKENKELGDQFKKTNSELEKGMKKSGESAGFLSNQMKNLGGVIAGAFAVHSLVNFGKQILNTRAEFQKLEAVLTNTLGSNSKAQLAMAQIQKFASQTPFSVVELTQSFVKLANQGFKPTLNELRKLGDLASSTGKSFDQLAEAIIDGQTGEFERLKEFGIRASKEGDKVTFTFKGVQTQTEFTNEAIRDYILSLGDLAGVSGSMEAISKTLGGQISNLGDAWESMLNVLGGQTEGVFSDAIGLMSKMLTGATTLIAGLEAIEKQSKLTFGSTLQDEVEQSFKALTDAGLSQGDAISQLLEKYYNLSVVKKDARQATEDELSQLSKWNPLHEQQRLLLESVVAQYDGEIKALKELLLLIPQLKKVTDDATEGDKERRNTVNALKEDIKKLTESIGEMEIGSNELSVALTTLKDKQQELANALNPVNREFGKQYTEMQRLSTSVVGTAKNMDDEIKALTDNQLKTRYKELYGIEIDGKSPMELLMEEHIKWKKQQENFRETAIEGANVLSDTLFEITRNRLDAEYEYEKAILKARLEQGKISQNEYETELKRSMREQFIREKRIAEFEILIAGAIASAKAWSSAGGNPAIALPLQALIAAETIAQLAIVESQPMPIFEKGGWIGGQRHRDGGTIIEAEKDEFMVRRERALRHKSLVEEINDGDVMSYITQQYVYPALAKQRMDFMRDETLADNIARSLEQNAFNDGRMVGWLQRIDKSTHNQTDKLVGVLKQTKKDIRNV